MPDSKASVRFFQNLVESFLKYAFKPDGTDSFKADGIMVTHPDADHIQGVVKLFEEFPPNQLPQPGKKAKFEFQGPLLLTEYFKQKKYKGIIKSLEEAKFVEQEPKLSSGDQIIGFDKCFTFFYPLDDYPGILYRYLPPVPALSPSMLAVEHRYSTDRSKANKSSILLVVNDPNTGDPLISLNGDALGHSIIQSLDGAYPNIFKVPHHGSVHNSIALEKYNPNKRGLIEKLLAARVLLQLALNKRDDDSLVDKLITEKLRTIFDQQFTRCKKIHKRRKRVVHPLVFDVALKYLAKSFKRKLVKRRENASAYLKTLAQIFQQINSNLNDPNVKSVDIYTHEIEDMAEFEIKYDKIKKELCASSNTNWESDQARKARAHETLFSFLETEKLFSNVVAFHANRKFYSKINAKTYFISSGQSHGHPSWEVVNGIIAAAHDKHRNDPNYKCRILLTSGNNIQGDKVRSLDLKDRWTRYCSLQYFASDTASVEVDAIEDNPLVVLPGAIKWKTTTSDEKLRKLLRGYNQTKGVKELITARAANSGRYEIKPYDNETKWLQVHVWSDSRGTHAQLGLSATKTDIAVQNISTTFEGSVLQDIITEFSFGDPRDASAVVTVFGLLGYHTPESKIKSYTLRTDIGYLVVEDRKLSYSDNIENATSFQFAVSTVTVSEPDLALNLESTAIADASSKSMLLEEFLKLIQYTKNTIQCKEILNTIVSQQFITQLLKDYSNSAVGEVIASVLGYLADGSSTFLVEDSEILSARIKLVMQSEKMTLHDYKITGVEFIVNNPKTVDQNVTLELGATDGEIPVTLVYPLKSETFVRSFHKYLITLGIMKTPSYFRMYDALILLNQSGLATYTYLSSLACKMLGNLLEWNINEEVSIVEFVDFPTSPVVTSATLVAEIPDNEATVDLGMKDTLKLTKVGFTLPSRLHSVENMHLFASAFVADIEFQIKACRADEDAPPTLQLSLSQSVSLRKIVSLLQISTGISEFPIPLTPRVLKDISITTASFVYQQGVQNSEQIYLSSIAFGITFDNLDKYLPTSFSNLKSVHSQVKIYQPTLPHVQIGLQIGFEFSAILPEGKNITLSASFTTEPVPGDHGKPSSHNFTVSVNAKSDVVGATDGGVTLADFCQVFGLAKALKTALNVPILNSILQNVELKQLVLAMNTGSKEIKAFVLELRIFNWAITPDKIVVDEATVNMSFIDNEWASKFNTTVVFNNKYFVDAQLELHDGTHPSKFNFTNQNIDFTIAKFLEIFGLGNLDNIPVAGQILKISVNEASIQMLKTGDGAIAITEGRVALYSESITIGSLFHLSQVNCSISFILDPKQNCYIFGFAISGFINDSIYLDVKYDNELSVLSGQVFISSLNKASFTDVLAALNKDSKSAVGKNDVFNIVSQSFTLDIAISVECISNNFKLTDLVVNLGMELSIKPFMLQKLMFEYHNTTDKDSQTHNSYKLAGELVSNMHSVGAIIEFDLTNDTTENSTVKASLMPTEGCSLTLNSFLSALSIAAPPIPEIKDHPLPSFSDISLTKGTITLSLPSCNIIAFEIEISTVFKVTILESPLIKLSKLSLQVKYNSNSTPTTKAFLTGEFSLGNVKLMLKGSKEEKGTYFTLITKKEHSTVDIQESFNQLTPKDFDSSVIPSNVGIPQNFNVSVARLDVELLYALNKKLVRFAGESRLAWHINLGFQQFIAEQLGGNLCLEKSSETNSPKLSIYLFGQFKFTDSVILKCELHFGPKSSTVLSVLATNDHKVSTIADDILGFKHPKEHKKDGIKFQELLPDSVQSIKYSKLFININFTETIFLCFGELVSIGHGLLIAGQFSANSQDYGYIFGISLPEGFVFSNLLPALSSIDEILTINNVNCLVVTVENTKIDHILTKLKAAKDPAIYPNDYKNTFPFEDLNLDRFTNDQMLVPGLSIYGEFNFHTSKLGSLFNSILQITSDTEHIPNIIISSLISKDPSLSEFKAYITELTLLGGIHFTDVTFSYKPVNELKTTFELSGTVTLMIGKSQCDFLGKFKCSNALSEFSVSSGHAIEIIKPLGMYGIKLEDARLIMTYNYPVKKSHSSSQTISAKVNFHSKKISSSNKELVEPLSLKCVIIFVNYIPTIVDITLRSSTPLTIADFIKTVFGWEFDTNKHLNIGFVSGNIYYAKLKGGTKSIEINRVTYKNGYHISADIEIFGELFTINAVVASNQVSLTGYAHSPLDLGFAKLTGVDDDDTSKPDESKSPEVYFVTNSKSTSVFLNIGFVLFETPLGTARLGYKSNKGKNNFFFGQLTYHGRIGFIENPSIDFEWTEEEGFKVTQFEAVNSLMKAFDFFDEIRKHKDSCGTLVDLMFKKGIEAKFCINIKLSKTKDPDKFLADIDITGTYDVLLLKQVKIASVPIPNICVGIPIENDFNLSKLPKFILDLLAKNSRQIVQQIAENPERLVKILAISVLKQITKEIIRTLVCRNVDSKDLDPAKGGEDVIEDDFKNAEAAESEFSEAFTKFEAALESEGLLAAGVAAAAAAAAGSYAVELFFGIVTAASSILAFFVNIVSYINKKKKAIDCKKRINDKINDIKQKMSRALDIKQNPSVMFNPPDQLTASWKPLKDKAVKYHVIIKGILLTHKVQGSLGQINTSPTTLYDSITSDSSIKFQDERLYDAVGLKLYVNGTLIVNEEHTYNGPVYIVDVAHVHPTLHPPSNIRIVYHHLSLHISTAASPVKYAEKYHFELVTDKDELLAQCFVTSSSITKEIQCNFSHSVINSSTGTIFKVRGQSLAKSGSNMTSSAFGYSNQLTVVDAVRNLQLAIPHFGEKIKTVSVSWKLSESVRTVAGFLCQVIHCKSKEVLLSKDIDPSSSSAPLPTTCQFSINAIISAFTMHSPNDPASLQFQVSASSNSDQIIDSKFVGYSVVSLQSPESVTCNFSGDKDILEISWIYVQATLKYGIQIHGVNSKVVFSKLVQVAKTPDIESGKVGIIIPYSELQSISDPNVQYIVEITSIADGSSTMDSLFPSKAESPIQVLHAPAAYWLMYTPNIHIESVTLSSVPVKSASKLMNYLISKKLCMSIANAIISPDGGSARIPVDSFIDKISSGDTITGSVKAFGQGYFLSSKCMGSIQHLKVLSCPTRIEYSYAPKQDTITLSCLPVYGENHVYKLGFIGSLQNGSVSNIAKIVKKPARKYIVIFSANELRINKVDTWKGYAQTTLINDSRSELPSPHLFLKQDVKILSAPDIMSMQFNKSFKVLTVTISTIVNTSFYCLRCVIYDAENAILQELSRKDQPSDNDEVFMKITFGRTIEEMFPSVATVSTTVVAVGWGYYLTSEASGSKEMKRHVPPINLTCSYSSTIDVITVSCQNTLANNDVLLGLGLKSNPKKFFYVAEKEESDKYKVHISGQLLRDADGVDKEWLASGQALGNGLALPSNLAIFPDHVKILKTPEIISAKYKEATSVLSVNWSNVSEAIAYKVTVCLEVMHGTKFSFTKETAKTNIQVDMHKQISDWDNLYSAVESITITICCNGDGLHINSSYSHFIIKRVSSPSRVSFSATDAELTVTWDNSDPSVVTDISYCGQYGLVKRERQGAKICTLQKRFLTFPTASPQHKTVEVNLTATKAGCLPSIPTIMQSNIQTQTVLESKLFGIASGQLFDDTNDKDLTGGIVGIEQLLIYHDSSIHGIKGTYYLADCSSYVGSLHGSSTGNCDSLLFSRQEAIVAVTAMCSSTTRLSQLVIVTLHPDGNYKRYGPYGNAVPNNPEVLKLSGNILAIKGMVDDHFVNAFCFKFTFAHPLILVSTMFGGGGVGSSYDEHTLTCIPRTVGIKSIKINFTSDHIATIQSTYILQNGETLEAPTHGIQKHMATDLQFEVGETVIQVKGSTSLQVKGSKDYQLQKSSNIIKQLAFRTQRKDGSTKSYGSDGESPFVITGTVLGQYGYSGWFDNALGFYYSLQRTEMIGGSGGNVFDVDNIADIAGIKSLKVKSSSQIKSIEVIYFDTARKTLDPLRYGKYTGEESMSSIDFEEDEEIVQIRIGIYQDNSLQQSDYLVGRLHIVTHKKDGSKMQYGPYGNCSEKEFTLYGRVVAFFGRSSHCLDAIGMYYIPV